MAPDDKAELRPASGVHARGARGAVASVLGLQRTRGNRYVRRMLDRAAVQRKCACGASGAGVCEACRERSLMLKRDAPGGEASLEVPSVVSEVLRSPGQPLEPNTLARMEESFGQDLSAVRVHTGGRAAESARAVNALAYTVGRDVVFGPGQYAPGTRAGERLLAHELTHAIQQGFKPFEQGQSLRLAPTSDPSEREADLAADAAAGGQLSHVGGVREAIVARAPEAAAEAAPKSELKDEDIDRWLVPTLMMLVRDRQTVLNESYVRKLVAERDKDPALAKAFEEARKKVRPALQHPDFAAVLSAPDLKALPTFFAIRAIPIIIAALTPGAQDVLAFIERRFVRDSSVTTLDLLESMGRDYKSINWVYDDYPGGTTIKDGDTKVTITVVGGSITVDSAAVAAAEEKAGAKEPAAEGAKEGAAKKVSRSVAVSSKIIITNAQATIKREHKTTKKTETSETAPNETIIIVNNNKKQSAKLNVVGAVVTTAGKSTTLTGGTATVELDKDTVATFVGPSHSKAVALAGDFQRLLPEMKPNLGASAVLREHEFAENKLDWWAYIESELDNIPGEPGKKLNRLALPSFLEMRAAARRDGITLDVRSSHRDFKTAEKNAANVGNASKVASFSNHMLGLAIDFALSHRDLSPPKEEAKPETKPETAAPVAAAEEKAKAAGEEKAEAAKPAPAKKAPEKPKYLEYKEMSTAMPNVIAMRHSPVHKWLFLHAHKYNWHPYHNEPWHWEYNLPGLRRLFVANVCRDPASRNEPVEDSSYCVQFLTDVVELLGDPKRVRKAAEEHRKWEAEELKKEKLAAELKKQKAGEELKGKK